MSGEMLQRRAAQLQLGVLHLDLRELPVGSRDCYLLPISTSEPLLTLQGAASCVSSQSYRCRDFQTSTSSKRRRSSSQQPAWLRSSEHLVPRPALCFL